MTTPGSRPPALPGHSPAGDALRAAADFIESSGVHDRVIVTCSPGRVRIRISAPWGDTQARQATLTRLAALVGGTARQEHEREFPSAELRAAGAIGPLAVLVSTSLPVRHAGHAGEPGRPFAAAPDGAVTTVPGRLPDGWRWVTALDPDPGQARAAGAPALAARDCPPLTGAALQAAARQGTAAQPATPAGPATATAGKPPSWSRSGTA